MDEDNQLNSANSMIKKDVNVVEIVAEEMDTVKNPVNAKTDKVTEKRSGTIEVETNVLTGSDEAGKGSGEMQKNGEAKFEPKLLPSPSGFGQEVSVFDDLVSKQSKSDTNDQARWRLVVHDSEANFAVYSWLVNSLVLVLRLGEKLKPKKSRKSLGRQVVHWTVTKIYLESAHRAGREDATDSEDDVFDAAHFSVTRKFPESALRSQCPNTYSLSSLLKSISAYVTPASTFLGSLYFVQGRYRPFSVKENVVTVGFVSLPLGQAFDVQVDFNEGFRTAPNTFKIVKTIGAVNKEALSKIVLGVSPGPEYIKEMATMMEQYLGEKEKRLGVQKQKV